jgi:hypothetical protein
VVGAAADMGAFESGATSNSAPVADAGPDQSATVGQSVQLTGGCTDADSNPTTAAWSFAAKPTGSTAALSSTTVLNPTFTPDLAGVYVLRLVCSDGTIGSDPSSITATVN